MIDPLYPRGPHDRARIDLEQEWECRWWCKSLGVTRAELTAAVAAVGESVADIDRYLHGERAALAAGRQPEDYRKPVRARAMWSWLWAELKAPAHAEQERWWRDVARRRGAVRPGRRQRVA